MKIRIQGNSLRFRLSKADVKLLTEQGGVSETTSFGESVFSYEIVQTADAEVLSASFENGGITMRVPSALMDGWATNDVVGFEATIQTGENETLFLLLEKDFKCLDNTAEDQSDHYENPKTNC